jgi:ComF family protein
MKQLSDLFFPALCCACDQEVCSGEAFCALCALSLQPVGPGCTRCGGILPCRACHQWPAVLRHARALFRFEGAVARAIRRLKWSGVPELGRPLGRLLRGLLPDGKVVLPVPLHPRRLYQREYNQAALLALESGHPRVDVASLVRVRDTPPQSALDLKGRTDNVRDAFLAHARLGDAHVILVDDVMTSGATARACAEALERARVASVEVVTLARVV